LREGVTREQPVKQDGYLPIPDWPGLGIGLEMEFIEQHRVS